MNSNTYLKPPEDGTGYVVDARYLTSKSKNCRAKIRHPLFIHVHLIRSINQSSGSGYSAKLAADAKPSQNRMRGRESPTTLNCDAWIRSVKCKLY